MALMTWQDRRCGEGGSEARGTEGTWCQWPASRSPPSPVLNTPTALILILILILNLALAWPWPWPWP